MLNGDELKKIKEAELLIIMVLEHLSAGRNNIDLMKERLIAACKKLPILNDDRLIKYC